MYQQLGMGSDEVKQNKTAPRFSTGYGLLKQMGRTDGELSPIFY